MTSCNSLSTLGSNFFVFFFDIETSLFFFQSIQSKQRRKRRIGPDANQPLSDHVYVDALKVQPQHVSLIALRCAGLLLTQAFQRFARFFHLGRIWHAQCVKLTLEIAPLPEKCYTTALHPRV